MSDRARIYAAALARATATGLIGVILGVYLAALQVEAVLAGLVVSAGLAGGTAAVALVTAVGDRLGRRRLLVSLAVLSALGGAALGLGTGGAVLLLAALGGMVNGMGRDRGAAMVLEQAILPATVSDEGRTMAFARYNVLQDVGHALGSLLAGVPALALGAMGGSAAGSAPGASVPGLRAALLLYAALALLPALAYARLSVAVEPAPAERGARLSPATRRVVWRLSTLFGIDSLAGGFLTTALLAYFFHERFGVGAAAVGPLFAAARLANAASHLGAAWLARRIGLVNTMVFTHAPSSLLLVTVAVAPSFPVAAALFLLREGLVEMDVPTRQSYVMALVRPEERTRVAGITHLVRLLGWTLGPLAAGALMQAQSLWAPLVVAAALKIGYDALLYVGFRHLRAPEERGKAGPAAVV